MKTNIFSLPCGWCLLPKTIGNVSDKRTLSLFETEEFECVVSTSIPHMPSDNKHLPSWNGWWSRTMKLPLLHATGSVDCNLERLIVGQLEMIIPKALFVISYFYYILYIYSRLAMVYIPVFPIPVFPIHSFCSSLYHLNPLNTTNKKKKATKKKQIPKESFGRGARVRSSHSGSFEIIKWYPTKAFLFIFTSLLSGIFFFFSVLEKEITK